MVVERFVAALTVRGAREKREREGDAACGGRPASARRSPPPLSPSHPPSCPLSLSFFQVRPEILASVEPEDVEAALRSCLLKLQFLETSLKPLPAGERKRGRGAREKKKTRERRRPEKDLSTDPNTNPRSLFFSLSLSLIPSQAAPLRSSPTPPTGPPCPSPAGRTPTPVGAAGWAPTATTASAGGHRRAARMAAAAAGRPPPRRWTRPGGAGAAAAALATPGPMPSCPSSPRPRAGARWRCRCLRRGGRPRARGRPRRGEVGVLCGEGEARVPPLLRP